MIGEISELYTYTNENTNIIGENFILPKTCFSKHVFFLILQREDLHSHLN